MTTVSFGANFISHVQVKKIHNNNYKTEDVAFVELDSNNLNDRIALDNIAKYWEYDLYAQNIATTSNQIYAKELPQNKFKIYAISSQKSKFEYLEDQQILGASLCEKLKHNGIYIDYLQINPEYIYSSQPKFKRNGSAILDGLKNLYNFIVLKPSKGSTSNFYLKNDFIKVGKYMFWRKRFNK